MDVYIVNEIVMHCIADDMYYTTARTASIDKYVDSVNLSQLDGEEVYVKSQKELVCVRASIIETDSIPVVFELRRKWYNRKNLSDWDYYTEEEVLQSINDGRYVFINSLGEVDVDDIETIKAGFAKVKA